MVAQNASDELPFGKDIDVKKISNSIDDTTNTMYVDDRYIELTQEQLALAKKYNADYILIDDNYEINIDL